MANDGSFSANKERKKYGLRTRDISSISLKDKLNFWALKSFHKKLEVYIHRYSTCKTNYPTGTVSVNTNYPTGSVINKLAIFSSMGVSVWRLQIGLMLLKEGVKRALQGLVTGAL